MKNVKSTEDKFKGFAFGVESRVIEHPVTGAEINRDIVTHAPVVVCVVQDDSTKELLITKEFRAGVNEVTRGLVAGFIDESETPEKAAVRETEEESGFPFTDIRPILSTSVNSSEGFTDETAYLFHVTVDKNMLGSTNFDEDEFVEGEFFTPEEVKEMIKNGEIKSAQCLTALLAFFAGL